MKLVKLLLFALIPAIVGCKTVAFFDSPNNLMQQQAEITMLDSSVKKGLLTVSLEATYNVNFVSLVQNGKTERVLIDSIQYYSINKNVYVPKMVSVDFEPPFKLLFVKQLTPGSSRIQLYELYQNSQQRDTRETLLLYFISLPSFERLETWGMGSKNLVPNFDKKMSRLVADCPMLAAKIEDRQKGYYFTQMALSNIMKKEVLQKIIEEYNLCK